MKINSALKSYIEENIFPSYAKNDLGHNLDHIKYVIERSFKFASTIPDINYDMVYVVAAYHDIGYYIDAKNHEMISSEMLLKDDNLKQFFTEEELKIIAEAVYDHRASLEYEPRSIYGKIISSADRSTSMETNLRRIYLYSMTYHSDYTVEQTIEEARMHILDKFGKKGYATDKMYFEDKDYKLFLQKISELVEDKERFKEIFIKVNNIKL